MDYKNLNSYQTPLDDELVKALPKEVYADLIEYIDSVQMISHLIAPKSIRGVITDRPFMLTDDDEIHPEGRREVDISKPHILEDMDFFRERALFYQENGRYTNIMPNGNPQSDYAKFWKEEVRRWKHGLTRPYGEWIPGQLYFYWNYSPIWLVETTEKTVFNKKKWIEKLINPGNKKVKSKKKGERLRKFPKPWLGDYLFYHYMEQGRSAGSHGKLLKTRGVGFSFKMGSISPCNMYTYTGTGNSNYHLASEKTFLEGDKGIFGKVVDCLDWIAESTPLPRMRIIDSPRQMQIQLGYKDEYGSRKGMLSSVFGISLKDNPDKARGVRGALIHYEEDGLFPNLEKAWGVNRKAVEDGDVGFGYMLAGGTGGVEGGSFEGSEKLFYSPGAYNILSVPNVYDKNTNGGTECGFFWGCYLNRNECYDEDTGEPDVIKALLEVLSNRRYIRYNSTDPSAITQAMAEEPIVPQEAVMRTEGTIFPVADLKDVLSDIMPNLNSFVSQHFIGRITANNEMDVFSDLVPVRDYPIKDNKNKAGCLEVFQKPIAGPDGKVPFGRYIAGCDPYDDDESTTNSLGSVFILDTITDQIVAEYTGRPRTATEFYENTLRMLKYFNAICNYENDKKGMFAHFDRHNCLYLLADNPQILKDQDMMKPNYYGNKAKGTNSGTQINRWGRRLQADWLMADSYHQDQPEEKEGEEPVSAPRRLNLHNIRSIGYLKELIAWNIDINTDRVSAMGMLMILREDRAKIITNVGKNKTDRITEHKFWDSHFGKGTGKRLF
jgi:hypothetical protein